MSSGLTLSQKSKEAIRLSLQPSTEMMVFEGTIRSSKTVTAIAIFVIRCLYSRNVNHLIACKDYDAIETHILHSNGFGILDIYGSGYKVTKSEIGGYYVSFTNKYGKRARMILAGYEKAVSYEKILGSSLGCVLIDEVNIADERFVDECFARQVQSDRPFTIWTLNGDDPNLWVYKKYVNRCIPIGKIPGSIRKEMTGEMKGHYYLHWTFPDNPSMDKEKIERAMSLYPVGSYYYNIKILGLRGRAEGSVFSQFLTDTMVDASAGKDGGRDRFLKYCIGLDLGNNDIKRGTVLTTVGILPDYSGVVVLDSRECASTEVNALVGEITSYVKGVWDSLERKNQLDGLWVDSYGPIQVIMQTLVRSIEGSGVLCPVGNVNKFTDGNGRKESLDTLMILVGSRRLWFRPNARQTKAALAELVYDTKDGLPLDENQKAMDYYDSLRYALSTSMMRLSGYVKGE